MGLFDTIKSSYDLGPGFQRELQTKDLYNCCAHYWISPIGQLYEIDYSGTQAVSYTHLTLPTILRV